MGTLRALTPEEQSRAASQGVPIYHNTVIDPDTGAIQDMDGGGDKPSELSPSSAAAQAGNDAASSMPANSPASGSTAPSKPGILTSMGVGAAESIPAFLTGRATAALAGAKMPGPPIVKAGAAILGGLTGAGIEGYLQKLGLDKASDMGIPGLSEAKQLIDLVHQEHPHAATVGSLAALPFGGGGAPMAMTREGLKKAAIMAGLGTGVNVGAQVAQGQPIDLTDAMISGVGSGVFGEPIKSVRGLERKVLAGRIPANMLEHFAPAASAGGAAQPPGENEAQGPQGRMAGAGQSREDYYAMLQRQAQAIAGANKPPEVASPASIAISPDMQARQVKSKDTAGQLRQLDKEEGLYQQMSKIAEQYPKDSPQGKQLVEALGRERDRLDSVRDELYKLLPSAPVEPNVEVAKPTNLSGITDPTGMTPSVADAIPTSVTPVQEPRVAIPVNARVSIPERAVEGVTPPDIAVEQAANRTPLAEEVPYNKMPLEQLKTAGEVPIMEKRVRQVPGTGPVEQPSTPVADPATIKAEIQRIQSGKTRPMTLKEILEEMQRNQILGHRGSEGGFINFPGKAGVKKVIGGVVSGVGKVSQLENIQEAIAPAMEKLGRLGPTAQYVGKKIGQQMPQRLRASLEPWIQDAEAAYKGLNGTSRENVDKYLIEMKRAGSSTVTLSPEEQAAANATQNLYKNFGYYRQLFGPYVNDNGTMRPMMMKPNYVGEMEHPNLGGVIRSPTQEQMLDSNQLRDDFINFMGTNASMTPEEALKAWDDKKGDVLGDSGYSPEARALRMKEGPGLPDSIRDQDPLRVLKRYLNRGMADINYHQEVEQDPVMLQLLGLPDNGRGQPRPAIVNDPYTGRPIQGHPLKGNEYVKAMLEDYSGNFSGKAQIGEKFNHTANTFLQGTLTQAVNFVSSLGASVEKTPVKLWPQIIKAAATSFTKGATQDAINAGAARSSKNILPTVSHDMDSAVTQINNAWSKYTGAEGLARANDVAMFTLGKAVARNALSTGDAAFIKKFAPTDLHKLSMDQAIDHMGTAFAKQFTGSYTGEGLPASMLRTDNSPWWAQYAKLSRWSVERFNHWFDNVYRPATTGDLEPLLKSMVVGLGVTAPLINKMKEIVMDRKPKELTWAEYLKLGGRDHAYTMFSKLQTASNMGILGDMMFAAVQGMEGEVPRGFNNIMLNTIDNTVTRLLQFTQGVASGGFNIGDAGRIGLEAVKDNNQVLKILLNKYQGNPDTGNREEKIAERLGYKSSTGGTGSPDLPNPISVTGAYRNEDDGRLARIMNKRGEEGKKVLKPQSAFEGRKTPQLLEGRPVNYYEFIRDAQGEDAMNKAVDRDANETMRRYQVLARALERR